MAAEKELKVKLTGDSTQLGKESKKAVESLNEVKSAAQSLLSAFTGGLIGGGITTAVTSAVNLIAGQIREARQLIRDARSADLDTKFVSGARFFSRSINAPENTVETAIQNARQARADAAEGSLDALENFRRLGISIEEIRNLEPDKLFFRIANAFKTIGTGKQELAGAAGVLGLAQAQALVPYFAGGDPNRRLRAGIDVVNGERLDLEKYFRGDFANSFLQHSDYADGMQDVLAGPRYKRDLEPITLVGIGDEDKAKRLREAAAASVEATLRSQLSIEEQMLAIAQKRAELGRQIDSESNSVKRGKLLNDDAALFAQEVALANQVPKTTKAPALPNATPQADEFAQRGVFTGGQQRVPSILEKSLVELQTIVREVRETRKDNKQNFG